MKLLIKTFINKFKQTKSLNERKKKKTHLSRQVNKIKRMLPSLKEKKRYIVFQIKSDKKVDFTKIKGEMDYKLKTFLGDLGYGKAGIMIIDGKDDKCVMKVNHKHIDEVRSALILVKDLNNQKVMIQTLGVSGILKKAKERWF
jgi:ribonuclease P/MRP protein subunit POP5